MARLRLWRQRRSVPVDAVLPGSVLPGGAFALGVPSAGPVVAPVAPLRVDLLPLDDAPIVASPRGNGPDDPAQPPSGRPVDALPAVEPEPVREPGPPVGPRVGLVFGDGTHVVLDPSDPRAGSFAALADELNR